MGRIYFDCLSIHNYLERQYALDIEVVWENAFSSDGFLFKASSKNNFPDGTTVTESDRQVYDYYGYPIQVITWKKVADDYYKRQGGKVKNDRTRRAG